MYLWRLNHGSDDNRFNIIPKHSLGRNKNESKNK